MGFWARLSQGLQLIGQILGIALTFEMPGGSADLSPVYLTVEGRRFRVDVKVTREV